MKTMINANRAFYVLTTASLLLASCKKENSLSTTTSASSDATSATIAVSASSTIATTDTVYIMQPCGHGGRRDSISQADLPSAVSTYLSTNYSGYTFFKAFAIKNSLSTVIGYVAIIYYNDKPVALLFDAAGNFVRVLEQREKGDLDGPGWHHGGRFEGRDGLQKDTIALSVLPSAITTYISANYSTDTLIKAFKGKDSSYVVLSKNNGLFATVFDYNGNFVKRVQLPAPPAPYTLQSIEQSALPSTVLDYLNTTYPNYVFKKAFSISQSGTLKGYVIFIDANNTKYAVEFDASGNFVKAKTIF